MDAILEVFKEGLLQFSTGTSIWTLLVFSLMLLILWKYAWGPIINGLDNRANKIMSDLESAKEARIEADKLQESAHKKVLKAEEEAHEIINESKNQANKIRNDIIEKAHKEALNIKEKAEQDIEASKKRVVEDVKQEMIVIAVALASKLVRKSLTKEAHSELINNFLSEYEKGSIK